MATPEGLLHYANDRWYGYAGLNSNNADHWLLTVLHPEDHDAFIQRWAGALSRIEDFELEARCRHHDGVYRWFLVSVSSLKDANGKIIFWFGVSTDIQERKQVEHGIRFLSEACAALSQISDYQSTLNCVVALAVPDFADWCAIDAINNGHVQRLAAMHVDPARIPLILELSRCYPPQRNTSCIWQAADTVRSQMKIYDEETLAQYARDEGELKLMREQSLAIMLRLVGHEVRTVSDGLQAIEQAVAFAPEMILLDIGMPGVDGYEAARRIRSQYWDNPLMLVALTGWGQEEDRRRSVVAGFDYHFTKPIIPRTLSAWLRSCHRQSRRWGMCNLTSICECTFFPRATMR
jgi:PAS domain S-box-containing protein